MEYGVTHSAEWLLDNPYLIRSHIAEIRQNVPDNHNRILPVIAATSSPVRLRFYGSPTNAEATMWVSLGG